MVAVRQDRCTLESLIIEGGYLQIIDRTFNMELNCRCMVSRDSIYLFI